MSHLDFSADEILEIAERIERNGASFYRQAAKGAEDPEVQALLQELADQEDDHEATFKKMRVELQASEKAATAFDPDEQASAYLRSMADSHVFIRSGKDPQPLTGQEDAEDILQRALQAEKDTIALYTAMKDVVPPELGQVRLDRLIQEEVRHVVQLSAVLEELQSARKSEDREAARRKKMPRNLGEAIRTAIEYETKVCQIYAQAVSEMNSPVGKRIFRILAEEEEDHRLYLEERLKEWEGSGRIQPQELDSAMARWESFETGLARIEKYMSTDDQDEDLQLLKRALKVEKETADFYERMLDVLPVEDRQLFDRFVEIEQGHVSLVQAQMDSVSGLGFWFEFQEFDLEA